MTLLDSRTWRRGSRSARTEPAAAEKPPLDHDAMKDRLHEMYPYPEPPPLAPEPPVNLDRLEAELTRNRLDDIATHIRALTYGEMIEFAGQLWKYANPCTVDDPNIPGRRVAGIPDWDDLPMIWHRWSTKAEVRE